MKLLYWFESGKWVVSINGVVYAKNASLDLALSKANTKFRKEQK